MNANDLISSFLESVTTVTQRNSILTGIDLLLTSIYKINKDTLLGAYSSEQDMKLKRFLSDSLTLQKISYTDAEVIKTYLTLLKERLAGMPVVELTIALPSSEKIVSLLASWLKTRINKHILIDVTVDMTLIAGTIVSYNGKYVDVSAKKQLSVVLEEKESEILRLVK